VLTTTRGITQWGEIFDDTVVAAAMLDRLLHRSTLLAIDGDSAAYAPTKPEPKHSDRG
jgi:DNA replication protein DnaC